MMSKLCDSIRCLFAIAVTVAMVSCGGNSARGTQDAQDSTEICDSVGEVRFDSYCRAYYEDTISLQSGRWAYRVYEEAPMNEMVWWSEDDGRALAVYSHASETDAQLLTFFYREDGRIDEVREVITDFQYNPSDSAHEAIFARIYRKGHKRKSGEYNGIYKFVYDAAGRLTEIRGSWGDDPKGTPMRSTIKAMEGHHLEGDFRPVNSYWMSDILGGVMNMYCREVPDEMDADMQSCQQWIDFLPISGEGEAQAVAKSIPGWKLPVSPDGVDDLEDYFGPLTKLKNPPRMPQAFNGYPKTIGF